MVAITAESFADSLTSEKIDPRQLAARAVYNVSRMNSSKTLLEHAQKLSQRATTRSPKDSEVWRLQAEMFLAVGKNDEAATSIEQSWNWIGSRVQLSTPRKKSWSDRDRPPKQSALGPRPERRP
ncbi:MAG: hypothetical protein CM1200mP2_52900 [Planctomycetaceae bacterium]|nr:MAG: hypothetical protein CM1200mP2_52900 [Planctomycetaceae bacterium]